jgi:DNA-binding IclR family transcriptional regulator
MNLAAGRDQVGPSTQASQPANQDVSAAVAAALKKMTKQERSRTLKQLVDDGWLAFSQAEEGYYCLGVSLVVAGTACRLLSHLVTWYIFNGARHV